MRRISLSSAIATLYRWSGNRAANALLAGASADNTVEALLTVIRETRAVDFAR